MSDTFTRWRTFSLTLPDFGTSMLVGYAKPGTVFSKTSLNDFVPPLYAERIKDARGGEGLEETFVLQGYTQGEWETIKPIALVPGEEPALDFGDCAECGIELEEAEFALGNLCRNCLDVVHEAREAATW